MKLKHPAIFLILALISFGGAGAESAELNQLREIHHRLMDPNQVFSISATLAQLDALDARISTGDSDARGEVNFLRGYVFGHKNQSAEVVRFTREALRIDAVKPFLSEVDRTFALYRLATHAKENEQWDIAIDAYQRVIPRFMHDSSLSDSQRLGTRENLAYCLHEAGQYAEAMRVNREVLAGGERLFGVNGPQLLNVINNLAQNTYELKDFKSAQSLLERRLKIALRHNQTSHVDDSLFQLGVLAFEQGFTHEAEVLMKRRVKLARKSGDRDRIENAESDLRTLYEKQKK